jgi:5-methylthioadenosine/S-adenosylhomocysteine deaminase
MHAADLLLHARWLLPIRPRGVVLEHHGVAIRDGVIQAIGPSAELNANWQATQSIDLGEQVLMPGLINAHTHAAMALLRGLADDLPLMPWLQEHIWPAEQRWVSPEFVADGTRLACAEMLRGGVTCFNDMYFFPEVTAQVASEIGQRAVVGLIVIDFPTAYAQDADDYLAKGLALQDRLQNHATLHTAFAPHAPYTVSDAPLTRIAMLAEELDIPIHMHVHETAFEVEEAVKQHGGRPLARLDALGLLSPRLAAVHMTQLREDEITRLADTGVSVIHCPESNLKLASGFCPVQTLLEAGINVALGSDGAASNNDLDIFGELRTAALLAKGVAQNAAALNAEQALEMATLGGARALGLEERIGSIEVGKDADLISLDLRSIETQPLYQLASQLVYAASRNQVRNAWVAGKHVLHERTLINADADALVHNAAEWAQRIATNKTHHVD